MHLGMHYFIISDRPIVGVLCCFIQCEDRLNTGIRLCTNQNLCVNENKYEIHAQTFENFDPFFLSFSSKHFAEPLLHLWLLYIHVYIYPP